MTYKADRPFTLYFVRHGVTEPNFRGFRCGGDLDIPLMDIGCDQAYLLAKQVEKMNLRIGVIVTGSTVEELRRFLEAQYESIGRVVKEAGIRSE